MRTLRAAVLLILSLAMSVTAHAASPRDYYAATFGITLDKGGELIAFRLVEVLDPTDRRRTPQDIHPPQSYIDAARQVVLDKKYKPEIVEGHPKEFFTWLYYLPSQPDRADLDPVKNR